MPEQEHEPRVIFKQGCWTGIRGHLTLLPHRPHPLLPQPVPCLQWLWQRKGGGTEPVALCFWEKCHLSVLPLPRMQYWPVRPLQVSSAFPRELVVSRAAVRRSGISHAPFPHTSIIVRSQAPAQGAGKGIVLKNQRKSKPPTRK